MSTSFEAFSQPETEKKVPALENLAIENPPQVLLGELDLLSESAEVQPQQLADQGRSLGLAPEVTNQILVGRNYFGRLEELRGKIRKVSGALTVAIALGTPALAQADVEGGSLGAATPTLTESQRVTEHTVVAKDSGIEKEGAEGVTTAEGKEDLEKSEILKQFSDERLVLYQDLVATIITKGVTDPETMEKLGTLIGKRVQENKGVIAERVIAKAVPYYDGLKQIFEAVQGSKMGGEELTGFERLKHFSKGAFELAIDSSQLGVVGRFLHKLNRAADIADIAESAIDYAGILREIQNDPMNPKILEKVLSLIEKKTLVERVKGTLEDRAREAYETGAIENVSKTL